MVSSSSHNVIDHMFTIWIRSCRGHVYDKLQCYLKPKIRRGKMQIPLHVTTLNLKHLKKTQDSLPDLLNCRFSTHLLPVLSLHALPRFLMKGARELPG